jgi:plasmid maintenance system killer protein
MNLEKLKGDHKGHFSIRVNKQYRIIFRTLAKGKIEVLILELSKHYE